MAIRENEVLLRDVILAREATDLGVDDPAELRVQNYHEAIGEAAGLEIVTAFVTYVHDSPRRHRGARGYRSLRWAAYVLEDEREPPRCMASSILRTWKRRSEEERELHG